MTDIAFQSARQLAALIKARKIGAEELLDIYLGRIERLNPSVNAVIAMDIPRARRRARAADAALKKGESWGPLHGVPMTFKDSFDVAGLPSTWGIPELKDHRPARSAPVVERFETAGAIVFGKTNVAAYLIGWATQNNIYGVTRNPWDPSRSPGGSAGGSAAALAGGLTALDYGVDFGGGVRNVAHYCGIYGHKPTYGTTNLVGHLMPGIGEKPDLAVTGPLARGVDDLELALALTVGPSADDAVAWSLTLPPPRKTDPAALRVAVILEDPHFAVDPDVGDRIQAVADFLARRKATVSDRARPAVDSIQAFRVFGGLLMASLATRQLDENFWIRLRHLRQRFMAEDVGNDETLITHTDWYRLDTARHLLRRAWRAFFGEWDIVICPAAPTVALPVDATRPWHERTMMVKGQPTSPVDTTFWGAYFTVAHLPSTVAPAGLTASGLPVGVQIVGPEFGDLQCLEVARLLEREFCCFTPPPGWS